MNGMGGGGVGGVSGGAAGSFDLAGGHCSGVAEVLIIPIFTGVLQKKIRMTTSISSEAL